MIILCIYIFKPLFTPILPPFSYILGLGVRSGVVKELGDKTKYKWNSK